MLVGNASEVYVPRRREGVELGQFTHVLTDTDPCLNLMGIGEYGSKSLPQREPGELNQVHMSRRSQLDERRRIHPPFTECRTRLRIKAEHGILSNILNGLCEFASRADQRDRSFIMNEGKGIDFLATHPSAIHIKVHYTHPPYSELPQMAGPS